MAGCDIAIEFDRQGATYRGGEVVRGEVVVRVTDNVACNGLVLHRFWQTAGKGTKDTGPRISATLFQGQWSAGETYRYPFHFTAPAAPLSYRGQNIRIDHYVEARADVPWSFDPKAREPFYLEPGGDGGPIELDTNAASDPDIDIKQLTKGNTPMVAGIICILIGLFTMILAPILVPLGIGLIVWSAFVMNTRKKIGEVNVRAPSSALPGSSIPVQVQFTPTADAVINTITARLVGIERSTSGSGKSKKTHRATIHDDLTTLSAGGQTTPGRAVTVRGNVQVPDTSAFTFAAGHNRIIWRLELTIDIAKWPDWSQRMAVRVFPNVEGGAPAEAPTPYTPSKARGERDYDVEGHVHVRGSTPKRPPALVTDDASDLESDYIDMPELPSLDDPTPEPVVKTSVDAQEPPDTPAQVLDTFEQIPDADAMPDVSDEVDVQDVPTLDFEPDDLTDTIEEIAGDDEPHLSGEDEPDPVEPEAAIESEAEAAAPVAPSANLADAIARITGADRFSGEQETVMGELATQELPVSIEVKKIEWTISMNSSEGYRSGRTVIGQTPDGREIALRLPEASNEVAEALSKGDTFNASGRIVEWNSLYDRPELEADPTA